MPVTTTLEEWRQEDCYKCQGPISKQYKTAGGGGERKKLAFVRINRT